MKFVDKGATTLPVLLQEHTQTYYTSNSSHIVLNMPSSAVKVKPMATMDFILTMLKSRLFVFSCSSCFSDVHFS